MLVVVVIGTARAHTLVKPSRASPLTNIYDIEYKTILMSYHIL